MDPKHLGHDALAFIDSLDDSLYEARRVPFTEQVQIDREKVLADVERIAEALPSAPIGRTSETYPFNEILDRLRVLVGESRSIPLTAKHRVDREVAFDLLDQLRATIPAYVKEARFAEARRRGLIPPPPSP